jgi:hypothetical protein
MSHKRMLRPEDYRTISPEVASQIFELHKHYPKLGHDGLFKLLSDAGVAVDSREFTDFIDHHDIHGEKWELAWGHIPGRFTPWRWIGGLGGRLF